MIVLTKGKKVVDVVKSVNGNEVVRLNDNKLIYGQMAQFTQTEITEIPTNIDTTKFGDYEYENGVFTRVNFPVILKSELLSRLTEDELDNIINFEDVITDIEKKKLMRKVMFKFNNYQEVDLGHPDTANFANALVYCGILTVERVNVIIGV
jgi:hypothetical protein